MTRRNRLGTLSLAAASAGFAAMAALRHFGIAAHPGWGIAQAGFEAGMVGGCADWFAVSALFRPIPCRRFKIMHTDLIVEKRAALSKGIVDMVQHRWLGPATLAEHLDRLSLSRQVLDHLESTGAREKLVASVRELLHRLAGTLDAPEIAGFLERALRDQLSGLEWGPALGGWLEARIAAGDTGALWDFLAGTLAESADRGDFKEPILRMLRTAAEHHKDRGFLEKLKIKVGELFFDYGQVSEDLSKAFAARVRDIQQDPAHPLRGKLDGQLLSFARRLRQGDPEAAEVLGKFQARLAAHADLAPFLARILTRLQGTLKAELAEPGTQIDQMLHRLLDSLVRELRQEPATQARIDAWARDFLMDLIQRNHGLIGEMVGGYLAKLSDRELVDQIEGQVGADLQYIRLNGAVVGSLVGMALAGVKMAAGL